MEATQINEHMQILGQEFKDRIYEYFSQHGFEVMLDEFSFTVAGMQNKADNTGLLEALGIESEARSDDGAGKDVPEPLFKGKGKCWRNEDGQIVCPNKP